jgi:hypothetical protein
VSKKIVVLSMKNSFEVLGNLIVIAIAGAAHELKIPLLVQRGTHPQLGPTVELDIEEEHRQILLDKKEEMRAALRKRLDPILHRKAMRAIYAEPNQYEEP